MEIKGNKSLAAVLQAQSAATQASAVVKGLEVLVKEQESKLAAFASPYSTLPSLLTRRADLLAEIATEQATAADLALLDSEIQQERGKVQDFENRNAGVITDTRQTLEGLHRKLEAAENESTDLDTARYFVINAFLANEAEQTASEYLNHASQTAKLHRRLLALNELLGKHNRGATFASVHKHELTIPLFRLAAHMGMDSPSYPGQLHEAVETQRTANGVVSAVKAEREKFIAAGVELY